jgi:hypothetical protein
MFCMFCLLADKKTYIEIAIITKGEIPEFVGI